MPLLRAGPGRALLYSPPVIVASGGGPVVFDAVSPVQIAAGITTISWDHTPIGAPSGALVGVAWYDAAGITSVTYGGVPMTLGETATGADANGAAIYGLASPPSGMQTVVINFALAAWPVCASMTVTGSHASSIFRNAAENVDDTGSNSTISLVIPSDASDLTFSVFSDGAGQAVISTGAGETVRFFSGNGGQYGAGSTEPGAASVTHSYTIFAAAKMAVVGASIRSA